MHVERRSGPAKRFLHVEACLGAARELCSYWLIQAQLAILSLSLCGRLVVEVQPGGQEIVGFNGQSTKVVGTVIIKTQIGECEKDILYQVARERSRITLGYHGLKDSGFAVDCHDQCLVKDGGARIMCHSVEVLDDHGESVMLADHSPNSTVKLTRSG